MTTSPDPSSEPAAGDATERLDERLGRLDEIVARLEAPDVELEDALRLFEEGVRHLRAAQAVLRDAELRVERLLDDSEGAVRREPMNGAP